MLIDKHRDPQGKFVMLTSVGVWKLLESKLEGEDALEGVEVDFSGERAIVKSKSRARLKAIIEKAKALGIAVSGTI